MTFKKIAAAPLLAALTGVAHAQSTPADVILDSLREINGVPGLSAAVSKDGEIIWAGQAGVMDVENEKPVTEDTQFRLASVSKLLAAATTLRLAEDGLLDIDADIRTYVPDWPDHDGAVITLRQLAAHTSGVAHYDSGDRYDPNETYSTLNDSLSVYAHKPLMSAPGDAYNYSSYGYALMGAAIENVSGKLFAKSLNDAVVQPAKLTATVVEDINELPPGASKLYERDAGEIPRNDQRHVVGATGILSTPSDLVTFADAYMNGEIISAPLVEMSLTRVQLNNGEDAGLSRFAMGFGWRLSENWEGESVAHHSGATPGARSVLTHNRERNISAALLSNAQWTTRIETTGAMLSTAAAEGVTLDFSDCPVGAWRYEGVFVPDAENPPQADNARGKIHVMRSGDVCIAELAPHAALAIWLEEREARTGMMRAALITKRDNDLVFAIATPWGAFPLRWGDDEGATSVVGDFAGRTVSLKLSPASETN